MAEMEPLLFPGVLGTEFFQEPFNYFVLFLLCLYRKAE